MKLANPACRKARRCQPFCGMCNLGYGDSRLITDESLFGACRTAGKCLCKEWSDTENCYWINGKKLSVKHLGSNTYDCTPHDHPQHHKIEISMVELDANKQSEYNKKAKAIQIKFKESSNLWGGYRSWIK